MGIFSKKNSDERSDYKKEASIEFTIGIRPDNSVEVLVDGSTYNNDVKPLLRDVIAPIVGLNANQSWNTRELGSRLVDFINEESKGRCRTSSSSTSSSNEYHRRYAFKTIGYEDETLTSEEIFDTMEEAEAAMADFIEYRTAENSTPPTIIEARHGRKELHFGEYDWWYEFWIEIY